MFKRSLISGVLLAFSFLIFQGCGGAKKIAPPSKPAIPSATGSAREVTRITNESKHENYPAISPDGTKLLFHVVDETKVGWEKFSIVKKSPTGAGRTMAAGPYALKPAWLPDGSGFVYVYRKAKWVLAKSSMVGAGMTFLNSEPLGDKDTSPAVSPDGKKVAFCTLINGVWQICSVNMGGSEFTIYCEGGDPTWHPDGSKLLYHCLVGNKRQIFILDMNSGQLTQLTSGDYQSKWARWSADGEWITFVSNRDKKNHLYLMKSNGAYVTQLTMGDSQVTGNPSWSSDGYIYFPSNAGAPRNINYDFSNIWRLRPVLPQ